MIPDHFRGNGTMFGARSKTEDTTKRVQDAADRSVFRNLFHAIARIRKDAVGSIKRSKKPAPAGGPPHTRGRGGKNIRVAIRFAADKESAVAGPRESVIGEAGAAHEHGGEYEGDQFDQRPFMRPAMEANLDRFAADWAGSVGE